MNIDKGKQVYENNTEILIKMIHQNNVNLKCYTCFQH